MPKFVWNRTNDSLGPKDKIAVNNHLLAWTRGRQLYSLLFRHRIYQHHQLPRYFMAKQI